MSTTVTSNEQNIDIVVTNNVIDINVTTSVVDVNTTTQIITIESPAGAYPLPSTVSSVFGRTGAILALNGDYNTSLVTENTNLYFTNTRARSAISLTTTGTSGAATYNSTTGVLNVPQYQGGVTSFNTRTGAISLLSADVTGALGFTPYNATNPAAYISGITSGMVTTALGYTPVTNARTLTINGTTYDLTADRSWTIAAGVSSVFGRTGVVVATEGDYTLTQLGDVTITTPANGQVLKYNGTAWVNGTDTDTGLTSVGLSMPSAFTVSNSPLTANGTLSVTGAGIASQYVRGDGTLANFPTSGGGGSSVAYYLNGSVNQGIFVGNTYYEMNKVPVIGTGTDFTISSNGYISQFITDANDPALLEIPAGNWNFEMYFSASSGGGTPSFYVELYKYNGTTFTLIASSSAAPEGITNGTAIDLYTTALAVPLTTLTITDRLAIRVYVTNSGRTITLHTENSHLCEVITTFTTGLTALNGLTAQVQYFQTGTSGTDFNISSATATHTFNLPVASALNTGKLSSSDWSIFNNKQTALSGTGFVKISGTTISYDNSTYYLASNPSAFIALTALSAGTGISYNNTTGVITNSAPNQTVSLSNGTGISVSGTYPSFTIASTITQYTDALARASLSFVAGSGAYNSTTGVITIPTNTSQLTNGANYITLTSLSGSTGISYNNTTGAISSTITQYTDALARASISLTTTGSSGAATYNNTTGVFNIPQYTDQFVGTVTSVAALTLGTTGTDLSSSVATGTTTPVITLNVPTASATNRGALSSADWTTFNGKESVLTFSSPLVRTTNTISIPVATTSVNGYLSSTDWTTFNGKQGAITLTTTGTSGAATLVGNTLNIPQYTGGGGGGMAIGGSITSATAGSVLFAGASGVLQQDNANFFWDDTNNRLGIGKNSTVEALDVVGNFNLRNTSGAGGTGYGIEIATNSLSPRVDFVVNGSYVGQFSSVGTEMRFANSFNGGSLTFRTTSGSGAERMRIEGGGNIGIATTTIGSTLQINGNAAIGYSASTAAPANGLQVAGNIYAAGTGSSTTTPREVGISNFASTNAARFTFGDSANCVQNVFGGYMQIVSYHAMQIYGGRVGTAVGFNTGVASTDPSLNVIGTEINRPTLVVTAGASQSASLQQWRNSGGTPLSIVTSSGAFGIGTTTVGSSLQVNGNAAIGYSASTAAPTNGLAVSGNSGFGTTSPGYTATSRQVVAINGGSAAAQGSILAFMQAGVNKGYVFSIQNDMELWCESGELRIGNNAAANIVFKTNNTDRLIIGSTGNLGVGTGTIGSKLQVNGNVAIGYSASTAAPTNGLAVSGAVSIGQTANNAQIDILSSGTVLQATGSSTGATTFVLKNNNAGFTNSLFYGVVTATGSTAYRLLDLRNNNGSTEVFKVFGNGATDIANTITTTQYRLSALNTAPATSTSTGTLGEIRIDGTAIYVCTATNTWVRALLTTF